MAHQPHSNAAGTDFVGDVGSLRYTDNRHARWLHLADDHQPHATPPSGFRSKSTIFSWCMTCQKLREQQHMHYPQACNDNVQRPFCQTCARWLKTKLDRQKVRVCNKESCDFLHICICHRIDTGLFRSSSPLLLCEDATWKHRSILSPWPS